MVDVKGKPMGPPFFTEVGNFPVGVFPRESSVRPFDTFVRVCNVPYQYPLEIHREASSSRRIEETTQALNETWLSLQSFRICG
jgi:hypothetical protein